MILPLVMLAVLADTVVTIPKSSWKTIALDVKSPGARVDISFEIPKHVSRIQASILTRTDAQRFHDGRTVRPICLSGYQRTARMRCELEQPGAYVLLLDNRLDTRFEADVSLRIELVDDATGAVRTLSPQRKTVVITLSILVFLGIVMYSARQLMK